MKIVIQIGACDGKTDVAYNSANPDKVWTLITKEGWHGILVEPNPLSFDLLCKNYADYKERVQMHNIAISDIDGDVPFHVTSEDFSPNCGLQLSSLISGHVEKCGRKSKIITVKSKTINSFLDSLHLTVIDLLFIDTEGFDGNIIEALDMDLYLPLEIQYEHIHMAQEQQIRCIEKMRRYGYSGYWTSDDVISHR